jgi:CubicO group peptidase (beta-lactamase class C family)
MRLPVALALLLGGWGPRCTPPQPPPVLQEAPPAPLGALAPEQAPRTVAELRARVAAILEREQVPGAGLALVDGSGPVWVGGVGRRAAGGAAVDADTVFRVASITKSVVALGVVRLAEQGRLDLDGPLAALVPGVALENPWQASRPVTLAQALEHTAGFDDMHFNEMFTDDDAMTAAAALAINPRSRVVRWPPGTRFAYSNVGYTVAARALEVATGQPFDRWLEAEVLRPLGMAAAFRRTPALAARLATGHGEGGRPAAFLPIVHRPAGALLASAADLARLVHFFVRRGEGLAPIVSPAGLARIERSATLPYPGTDVDYGLGNYGDVGQPVRSRGHDGGIPGFISCWRYFPELGVGYVVLLNGSSLRALAAIRRLMFATLTRGRPLPPAPVVPRGPQLAAQGFAFASPRHELFGFLERVLVGWRLRVGPGEAWISPLIGPDVPLLPTPDGGFRHRNESGTSARVARGRDGAPVLLVHGMYAEPTWWPLARARLWLVLAAVMLLQLAPLHALGVLVTAALRRRAIPAAGLVLWPAVASVALALVPRCFGWAAARHALGKVHLSTVALCGMTVLFAGAAVASALFALRWSVRRDRPALSVRLLPSLAAVAALGLAVWGGANGGIGLCTWRW